MNWVLNMILCIGVGFGCFGWAVYKAIASEGSKNK